YFLECQAGSRGAFTARAMRALSVKKLSHAGADRDALPIARCQIFESFEAFVSDTCPRSLPWICAFGASRRAKAEIFLKAYFFVGAQPLVRGPTSSRVRTRTQRRSSSPAARRQFSTSSSMAMGENCSQPFRGC